MGKSSGSLVETGDEAERGLVRELSKSTVESTGLLAMRSLDIRLVDRSDTKSRKVSFHLGEVSHNSSYSLHIERLSEELAAC